MFLNIFEILDIIIMTLVVGFLFMNTFQPVKKDEDVLDRYMKNKSSFDWKTFWFAALVTAPAVILHEFGHKIFGLMYGLSATFHAACSSTGLVTGGFLDFYCGMTIASIVLKLINFGFIFFIPAFVQIGAGATVLQSTLIALAGPAVNLILFLIAFIILKYKGEDLSENMLKFLTLTKSINLFLFVFNILPIPGFDGFKIFSGLWIMSGL